MTRNELTEGNRQTILDALAENNWAIRQTHRELINRGYSFSRGTVSNVAAEYKNRETAESRLAAAEAKVRSLQGTNIYLRRLYGDSLQLTDEILAAVGTLPVLKPVAARQPKKPTTPVAAVNPLCDWHIGEVIKADEMEGLNEFNYAIAEARVEYLAKKVIDWTGTQRAGYSIDKIYIPLLADFISGNIHDELIATNEFSLPEALVRAAKLLAWYLSMLAPHFQQLVVDEIGADNHSRVMRKKEVKRKSRNNYNYVIFELVRAYLKDHKNIDFRSHTAMKVQIDIAGKSFLCEHGDNIRGWMGMPWYGLARANDKEARKRLKHGKPFDEVLRGHFHTVAFGDECGIVCGSLSGASELDVSASRFSLPYQVSFLVHPTYSWYNFCRWDLSRI